MLITIPDIRSCERSQSCCRCSQRLAAQRHPPWNHCKSSHLPLRIALLHFHHADHTSKANCIEQPCPVCDPPCIQRAPFRLDTHYGCRHKEPLWWPIWTSRWYLLPGEQTCTLWHPWGPQCLRRRCPTSRPAPGCQDDKHEVGAVSRHLEVQLRTSLIVKAIIHSQSQQLMWHTYWVFETRYDFVRRRERVADIPLGPQVHCCSPKGPIRCISIGPRTVCHLSLKVKWYINTLDRYYCVSPSKVE